MNAIRSFAKTLSIFAGLLIASFGVSAQEIPTKVNVQNRGGELPFSTTIGTDVERVDIGTGNLTVTIPIYSGLGRGLDFRMDLRYGARFLVVAPRLDSIGQVYYQWALEAEDNAVGLGWIATNNSKITHGTSQIVCPGDLGSGLAQGTLAHYYIWRDSNGVKHPLAFQRFYNYTQGSCFGFFDWGPGLSAEGILTSGTTTTPDIRLADGTKYSYSGSIWTDSNGNKRSDRVGGTTPINGIDTLGRTPIIEQNGTNQIFYRYVDSAGVQQTITVNKGTINLATSFNLVLIFGAGSYPVAEVNGTQTVISSIVLPDGRAYSFQYTPYGEISQITLPTGATVTYTWATLYANDKTHRHVASRTMNVNGQGSTWTFARTGSNELYTTTVTDPPQNQSVYTSMSGAITEARLYAGQATGTPLRKHEIGYDSDTDPWPLLPNDPIGHEAQTLGIRPIRITTTLETGLVSKKEFTYDSQTYSFHSCLDSSMPECSDAQFRWVASNYTTSRGNVTEVREYGFGTDPNNLPLVRKTTRSYLHESSPNHLSANIVNKVLSESIYDGAGNLAAKTDYEYDNYVAGDNPMQPTSGAPQHDAAYDTTLTTRGNATRVKRWRNTDGALLTTTYTYDDLGNIRAIKDPQGHPTTYSYSDRWANGACPPAGNAQAYVTDVTNALSQRVQFTYFPCSGLRQARRDENDILAGRVGVTSLYDRFGRLTQQDFPDGGRTTNSYVDTPNAGSVTTSQKIDAAQNLVTTTRLDGLGRAIKSELNSDPQGVVFTDTTYDAFGRVKTVSNPYRSTGEPTFGITTTEFDPLGRVTKVIPPDGTASSNHVLTQYSGNSTTVTDQAGKQRRSFNDALGRLIQVDEPGAGGPPTPSTGSATVNSVNPSGGVQTYNINAITATGWVTLSGGVQSTQAQSQPASQSSGSITVNGAEQSASVQTAPATAGSAWVDITGNQDPVWVNEPYWGCIWWDESGGCIEEGWIDDYHWVYDSGDVSVSVNGLNKTVQYWSASTGSSIASELADAINADEGYPVTAYTGGSVLYLTSKATGASSNYSLWSSSNSYQSWYFSPPTFVPNQSGSAFTGGANAQYGTVYDSGTVTVTVNQGAGQVVATANFGQSSTTSSIAADLRTTLNNSSLLIASGSGATINLTSEAAGAGTNYSLAVSWTYNTTYFGSSSFTASKSGNNMTGGSDAQYSTVYDSGTVTIIVNGSSRQVSYGQGSTAGSIAAALATDIGTDCTFPASASASGTTVNLSGCPAGAIGNGYALSASTTWNTSYFGSPSFTSSKSGNTLAGGVDGSVIYDSGTVTLTIAGCTPFTVNYSNGSTRDSVAEALRVAIAGSSCPVTPTRNGNTLSLQSNSTGSSVNYGLTWWATTTQGTYFGSPSFSLATSGMSGGQDVQPPSLAAPAVTLYTYDTLDNLTSVLQSGSRQRTFGYNSLSQLIKATNPESGTICYGIWSGSDCVNGYDNDGNLLTKTSPKPNQTNPAVTVTATHTYDALHRLTQKSFNDLSTPAVSYFYDQTSYNGLTIGNGKGQRTGMSDASGVTAWSYNITANTGWKTTERRTLNGVTKTVIYQNNLAGGLAQLTNPSTLVVNYGFDAAGRSNSASATLSGVLTYFVNSATYAPHGALATLANGGVINSTFHYNNRLQPCRMHVRTSGSAPTDCGDTSTAVGNVLDFKYSFNAGVANNGNVAQIENKRDPNRTQNFTYDELNRIRTASTQATSGTHAWGLQFGYDVWANLLSASVTQGSTPTLSVGVGNDNRIVGYCYDAAGNLLIEGPCGPTLTYTYDAENRITTTGGVTYTYDGDGKRVKKSNGKLYWTGLGSEALNESDLAGAITDLYIFFNGKRIARRGAPSWQVQYYFADHLGSSRIVTSSSGGILEDSDFYPFGGERVVVDSTDNRYKFTGKERDGESGLDYFGARYYASTSGRFLSPDEFTGGPVDAFSASDPLPPGPLPYADITNPQSLNKYTYTYNNPLGYTDPDGHGVLDFIVGVANAINSNIAFGAGRNKPLSSDEADGQAAGDAISVVAGAVETLLGAGVEAGGLVLDASGVGAVIGVPANVVGAAAMLHGSGMAVTGGANLFKKAYDATPENLDKMKQGKPPISKKDGHPVERHHQGGNPKGPVKDMSRTDHRLGDNYKKNHPNTNKKPSRIDRNDAAKQRRKHWKDEAKKHEEKEQQ